MEDIQLFSSKETADDTANDTIDNNNTSSVGGDCGDGVALTELGLSVS